MVHPGMVALNVEIPVEVKRRLKVVSALEGIGVRDMTVLAITRLLDEMEADRAKAALTSSASATKV